MKPTVYIESSVISYAAARPSRDVVVAVRQALTHDWWTNHSQRFNLRISALVEEEISSGDKEAAERRRQLVAEIPSLAISDFAIQVAGTCWPRVPFQAEVRTMHCTSVLLPRKVPIIC